MKRASPESEITVRRFKPAFAHTATIAFPTGKTNFARLSGDGKLVGVLNDSGQELHLIPVTEEKETQILKVDDPLNFTFSGDGKTLVAADGRNVSRWDLSTDSPSEKPKLALDFETRGEMLVDHHGTSAVFWSGNTIFSVDLKTGKTLARYECERFIWSARISPNGKTVIFKDTDSWFFFRISDTPEPPAIIKNVTIECADFMDDERIVVVGEGKMKALDLTTKEVTTLFSEGVFNRDDLRVSRNGIIMTHRELIDHVSAVDFWDAHQRVHLQTVMSSNETLFSANGETMCVIFDEQDIHILRRLQDAPPQEKKIAL